MITRRVDQTGYQRIRGPLKWHGGKSRLASRIVEIMPPHLHYVEPFAGGLAVLFAKPPAGVSEVVNDLDGDLMTFWQVLRDEHHFARFQRAIEAVPFSEAEWLEAKRNLAEQPDADPVSRALWFFIACRQSLAGRRDTFAPLTRRRTRRGMNEQASAWLSAVEGLPSVHGRLRRVAVLCRPALDVIESQDGPDTLMYCDPTYLPSARSTQDVFSHEMSELDHFRLLDMLKRAKSQILLSGYPSEMYETTLSGWNRHVFEVPNDAAGGRAKGRQTEVLWANF